jgi:hypothetical protein
MMLKVLNKMNKKHRRHRRKITRERIKSYVLMFSGNDKNSIALKYFDLITKCSVAVSKSEQLPEDG